MFSKKQVQRTSDLSFLQPILLKLDHLQIEQRHQRSDLSIILRQLKVMTTALALEKQASDYLEREYQETSPQTDTDNKPVTGDLI